MSTSAKIIFEGRFGRAVVYRHCDGYPEDEWGVLKALEIAQRVGNGDTADYVAAQFVFVDKLRRMQSRGLSVEDVLGASKDREKWLAVGSVLLGHGVGEAAGDYETNYTYVVTLGRRWLVTYWKGSEPAGEIVIGGEG